jgi:hypothetical protein
LRAARPSAKNCSVLRLVFRLMVHVLKNFDRRIRRLAAAEAGEANDHHAVKMKMANKRAA